MKISEKALSKKFESLSDIELVRIIDKGGLTDIAESAVKKELLRRNLDSLKIKNIIDEYSKAEKIDNKKSEKISLPFNKSMAPYLYLSIFILPLIFIFVFRQKMPEYFIYLFGNLPMIGIFLFVNNAYRILSDQFEKLRPKFLLLLLVPVVNIFYQYWSIHSLGKWIRKAIYNSGLNDIKFRGFLSEFYCHIFVALHIIVQVRIQYQISYNHVPFYIFMLERIIIGAWIFVAGTMIYDYSKIINRLAGKNKSIIDDGANKST